MNSINNLSADLAKMGIQVAKQLKKADEILKDLDKTQNN